MATQTRHLSPEQFSWFCLYKINFTRFLYSDLPWLLPAKTAILIWPPSIQLLTSIQFFFVFDLLSYFQFYCLISLICLIALSSGTAPPEFKQNFKKLLCAFFSQKQFWPQWFVKLLLYFSPTFFFLNCKTPGHHVNFKSYYIIQFWWNPKFGLKVAIALKPLC